jgi:hypothetical protein
VAVLIFGDAAGGLRLGVQGIQGQDRSGQVQSGGDVLRLRGRRSRWPSLENRACPLKPGTRPPTRRTGTTGESRHQPRHRHQPLPGPCKWSRTRSRLASVP